MLNYQIMPHSRSKDWVMLLHGIGGSSKTWYKQLEDLNREYNLLLPDFFGHGMTRDVLPAYTFRNISDSLAELLDHLQLQRVHILSISLGSVVACAFALNYSHRLKSMILAGAIQNLDRKTSFLLTSSKYLKPCMPYMWLYRFFAWIIMPGPAQTKSRQIFSREAVNLGGKEFHKWHDLIMQYPQLCPRFHEPPLRRVPKLFISGDQDYLFLPHVREYVAHDPNSALHVIPRCGHVCNIQAPQEFNRIALEHLCNAYQGAPQTEPSWQEAFQLSSV